MIYLSDILQNNRVFSLSLNVNEKEKPFEITTNTYTRIYYIICIRIYACIRDMRACILILYI